MGLPALLDCYPRFLPPLAANQLTSTRDAAAGSLSTAVDPRRTLGGRSDKHGFACSA